MNKEKLINNRYRIICEIKNPSLVFSEGFQSFGKIPDSLFFLPRPKEKEEQIKKEENKSNSFQDTHLKKQENENENEPTNKK